MRSFDLQVNGAYGVDFNADELTLESVHEACSRLEQDGSTGFLATFITDEVDTMTTRLRRFASFREEDELVAKLVRGFHVEGPFLNPAPGYRGAHPPSAMRPADVNVMNQLLDAGGDNVKLVTLAPECDPDARTTAHLAGRGIVVSAGHCDPSLDDLRRGIDAGLTMATHIGNGCPAQLHRHDNVIQRLLSRADRLWCCFIGDGVHVPPFALKNYLRAAGLDRSILVTDAISAAGLGPGRYRLAGWELQIGDDLVARNPDGDHFVGSTATMPRVESVLRDSLGLSEGEVNGLIYENPRTALGI